MCKITPITPIQRIRDKIPRPNNKQQEARERFVYQQLAKEKNK